MSEEYNFEYNKRRKMLQPTRRYCGRCETHRTLSPKLRSGERTRQSTGVQKCLTLPSKVRHAVVARQGLLTLGPKALPQQVSICARGQAGHRQ